MWRLSALKSKRKKIVLLASLLCGLVFAAAVAASLWLIMRPAGQLVRITSEGDIIAELDLSKAADEILEVKCSNGRNTIKIEDGTIYVSDSDCPDKTCIKMGQLGSGMPIVCLPHRLIIEYVGGENDAAAG